MWWKGCGGKNLVGSNFFLNENLLDPLPTLVVPSPALITPLPANIFPNRIAPNVRISILRNSPFLFFSFIFKCSTNSL